MSFSLPRSLALFGVAPIMASAAAPQPVAGWSQMTVRERIVIRVPKMRAAAPSAPVEWREKKGPKCIAAQSLAGALVTDSDVDFVLAGGDRVRAKLDDDCPTLTFYSGLYVKPAGDGMICADRDAIRSRSGARCEIDRFRTLVAKR